MLRDCCALIGEPLALFIGVITWNDFYSKSMRYAVHFLIGRMLIFVTFSVPSLSMASGAFYCEALFAANSFHSLPILQQINEIRNHIGNSTQFFETNGKTRTLDLLNNRLDQIPIVSVGSGKFSSGIYQIPSENLILKIHRFANQSSLSISESRFMHRLLGNYIGMTLSDTSRVAEFGTLITSQGQKYIYSLMHEAFPGEPKFTLKESINDQRKTKELRAIVKETPLFIQNLVASYLRIVKLGIIPSDPDLIISKSGKFLWIDTDFWKLSRARNMAEHGDIVYYLFNKLYEISPEIGLEFKAEIEKQLNGDRNISPTIHSNILFNLKLSPGLID